MWFVAAPPILPQFLPQNAVTRDVGNRSKRESGASLVELVLCVPMLFTLVAGMVVTGRQLAYYNSASQTTFNAALYAAGLSSFTVTNSEVKNLGELLLKAGVAENVLEDGIQAEDFLVEFEDTDLDGRGDLVKVGYHGQFVGAPMGQMGSSGFGASATMPILGDNLASVASPEFQNPSTLYCSDGALMVNGKCGSSPGDGSDGEACRGCADGKSDFCKVGTEGLNGSVKLINCAPVTESVSEDTKLTDVSDLLAF